MFQNDFLFIEGNAGKGKMGMTEYINSLFEILEGWLKEAEKTDKEQKEKCNGDCKCNHKCNECAKPETETKKELLHCYDCRYYTQDKHCTHFNCETRDDGFCYFAETKEKQVIRLTAEQFRFLYFIYSFGFKKLVKGYNVYCSSKIGTSSVIRIDERDAKFLENMLDEEESIDLEKFFSDKIIARSLKQRDKNV